MSGGVDSTAAAIRLRQAGYEVVGLTIRMWKGSRCCSLEDESRASDMARELGLDHVVVDAMEEFTRCVVEPFIDEYARGRTPSPCVVCNAVIKFAIGLEQARILGCSYFATGHYARVHRHNGRCRLLRGIFPEKDQSYFLHRLTQAQLQRALFPAGEISKAQARDLVRRYGLLEKVKKENHDICFVPEGGYASFVEKYRQELKRPGQIVDRAGRVLGQHSGFHRFTVGQRQGLAIAAEERLYVVALDWRRNQVIVGPREAAMGRECRLERVNWILPEAPQEPIRCEVQLRHQHPPAPAQVIPQGPDTVKVLFDEPQFGIAPGQAGVMYEGEEVLGGGWINT